MRLCSRHNVNSFSFDINLISHAVYDHLRLALHTVNKAIIHRTNYPRKINARTPSRKQYYEEGDSYRENIIKDGGKHMCDRGVTDIR